MSNQSALSDAAATLDILRQWREIDAIRALDFALARNLLEIGQQNKLHIEPISLLLGAISSLYLSDGHVCVDLRKLFERPERYLQIAPEHALAIPSLASVISGTSLDACLHALQRCQAVKSQPSESAPLALKGGRLYLSRFYHYELKIAEGIHSRLPVRGDMQDLSAASIQVLKQAIEVLFKGDDKATAGSQMHACAIAARSRFSIITGGPGTGKTTTVVKLLAALQSIAGSQQRLNPADNQSGKKLKIALTAPTGKAAARLNQSISASALTLRLHDLPGQVTLADIPQSVTTLHRVLGSIGSGRGFRHTRQNPLPIDILVIDEASMVDLSLMAAVIDALRDDTRLILLGDKDQLASVDAGAVLGQLAQDAHEHNYTHNTVAYLEHVTQVPVPVKHGSAALPALAQNIAMLNHSFRFDQNSGIGKLSKMVNRAAKNNALLSQFKQGQLADALWLITDVKQNLDGQRSDKSSRFIGHVSKGSPEDFQNAGEGRVQGSSAILPPIGYQAYLAMLMRAETTLDQFSSEQQWNELAQNVIACFERFQVLCAMRNGPYGVEALNLLIQNALIPRTVLVQQGAFYQGRPVLVTRNDYNLGLTNGDIGMVIWRWTKDAKGHCEYAPRVAFPSDTFSDAIRWFSPSRLQSIDTVFAMTVHKSQGSEFEHTCFVLPERINPVVTKELVYTAITRAKYWLSIVSPNENILSNAMNNPISRESGLMLEE